MYCTFYIPTRLLLLSKIYFIYMSTCLTSGQRNKDVKLSVLTLVENFVLKVLCKALFKVFRRLVLYSSQRHEIEKAKHKINKICVYFAVNTRKLAHYIPQSGAVRFWYKDRKSIYWSGISDIFYCRCLISNDSSIWTIFDFNGLSLWIDIM